MTITTTLVLQILIFLAMYVVFATLCFKWVWNSVVSDIFDLRHVSLWESFKLILLFGLLLGGMNVST